MSKSSEVKIYISCHKPAIFVNDSVFQPIKVGAIYNSANIMGAINDDSGKNISNLNSKFCELTAQYWAWKNASDGYCGFFHYRRYLSFNTKEKFPVDEWGAVVEESLDSESIKKYNLNVDAINKVVHRYDLILPDKRDVTKMPGGCKNVREQYLASGFLHERDLDIMMEVLSEKSPQFVEYAERYLEGTQTYLNNMFVMKRGMFEEYCEWLFDILLECEERIDYKDYSVEAIRTPGHLAERLLNIYLMKLLHDRPKLRVKELQTVAFCNTDPIPVLEPAFPKNNVAIALSADNYYLPYITTLINSIKLNSSKKYNYDIIVMHRNIEPAGQECARRLLADADNFSLRFINVSSFGKKFERLFLRGHFTIETWFRLLMPELLEKFDKILYLDSDMVVNADVADLYFTDIKGVLLAACRDADTAGLYNGFEPHKRRYMDEVLKMDNPYDYFQAGVILFNLKQFRKTYSVEEMLKLAASREWELLDQDVLNVLASGKVKYVDMSWNVMFDWRHIRRSEIISLAPKYLSDEYDRAHAHPKIIHYAGPDKPWNDPYADYADVFWKYARTSCFYEEILRRLVAVKHCVQKQNHSPKDLVRKYMIDKVFPYNTERRKKAIKVYLKIRHRY